MSTIRTYGTNYNGHRFWARVYVPHGPLGINAENVGARVKSLLVPHSLLLSVDLSDWRMDYNQNGVYFECWAGEVSEERELRLQTSGFKKSKSA